MRVLALVSFLVFAGSVFARALDSTVASPEPGAGCALLAPENLRCEYQHRPLTIETQAPRLDWLLKAHSEATRHITQKAYQIEVATSLNQIIYQSADLWDSGKVMSDATTQIEYPGKPLFSEEICYWRVRVWDQNDEPTPWSTPEMWQMGLLKRSDWQAKWIEVPENSTAAGITPTPTPSPTPTASPSPSVNPQKTAAGLRPVSKHPSRPPRPPEYASVPILRKDFQVGTKKILTARLYVTALGLYEMHINGKRVGKSLLAPDWTDYNIRCRYDAYDVTALVQAGDNSISALLGNGWYCGHIGNGGYQAYGKVPALFGQLEITYDDTSKDVIPTDSSWKSHASPVLFSDFMLGENYDARKEIEHWAEPGLDLQDWAPVVERADTGIQLNGRVDEAVEEVDERKPISLKEVVPGHWVYDLGQNMVGVVRLNFDDKDPLAAAGETITIRHGEMLNPDGTLYTANLRGAPSIDTYVSNGHDLPWQPRFTFHGFRYVELSGLTKAPKLDSITGIVVGSAVDINGEFTCSSDLVTKLQSNITWGMRGNYLSVPTDCPQRDERLGWMGDAEIFIATAAYNGDVSAFFTKWLVDVDDAQTPEGSFTNVSPSPPGSGKASGGVPAWGDAGVICPWTLYEFYGDTRVLKEHLPAMKRWVDWCHEHSVDLIRVKDRGSDFGDWLSQGENTPKDLIGTAFFAHSADLLSKSYAAVGDTQNAQIYGDLFQQIRDAFIEHYTTPDGHVVGEPVPVVFVDSTFSQTTTIRASGSQTAYALALEFNLVRYKLRDAAADFLAKDIEARGNHLSTGFVGVSHLLPALSHAQKYTTAYNVFLQETFPGWLFSVKQGATTIWERWDGWTPQKGFQNPGMNSFNHYSLGSCGEWMFQTIGGIQLDPNAPGFSHVIIEPFPNTGITSAHALYQSIRGPISTDWSIHGRTFLLKVTIPPNITATVYLPSVLTKSVQESGRPLDLRSAVDIKPLTPNGVPCEIGSGTYSFSCTMF